MRRIRTVLAMDIATKLAAATYTVDAAALRATLDAIQRALGAFHQVPSAPTAALALNRSAIADSVREVLSALDSVDLTAVRALSGMVREYRTEVRAKELRDVFTGLNDAWRARVSGILSKRAIASVVRLLNSAAPDVLQILGKDDDENAHSDLIAWLLDPRKAPVVAPRALSRIVARFADDRWPAPLDLAITTGSISVRREVVVARDFCAGDDLARVDISISGSDFVLAIENKVWSREHHDQTQVYWDWIASTRGLRAGLLLSPSGIRARCPQFLEMSYLELVSCLVDAASSHPISDSEEIVLASYLKTLARNIIPVEMRAVRELAALEQT